MVTFVLIFSAAYYVSDNKMISEDLIRITFIALAALTVPHMILVDYMKVSFNKNTAPRTPTTGSRYKNNAV